MSLLAHGSLTVGPVGRGCQQHLWVQNPVSWQDEADRTRVLRARACVTFSWNPVLGGWLRRDR